MSSCPGKGRVTLAVLYPYYMTFHTYPVRGPVRPIKTYLQYGGPNIPIGYGGDVGLVGAPTPIRLATLENSYDLPANLNRGRSTT